MPARFLMGQLVSTPAALAALNQNLQTPAEFLIRHQYGDWGETCEDDKRENERSLTSGDRIFSVYHLRNSTKIYVITEADRSSTCVLLPDEY